MFARSSSPYAVKYNRPSRDNKGIARLYTPIFIFFSLWPFGALLAAIRCYKKEWAVNIVLFFCSFFGFTMILTEGGDANRYVEYFQFMGHFDWSFTTFISFLYNPETRYVDVVQPLISYILSRFTADSRILLAVFGIIFGYFYSRNIWYLLENSGPRIRMYALPLLVTFTLLVGFWQINGFRFWCGAHVFLYGALPYLIEGGKRRLWALPLSVFFHFSFMLPVAVFLAFFFLGNRTNIFFYFFLISFFIKEIDFDFIRKYLTLLPDIFSDRAISYVQESVLQRTVDALSVQSWHAKYYQVAIRLTVTVLAVIVYFDSVRLKIGRGFLPRLFAFSLLFGGVMNILGTVPSVGRFITVGHLFFISYFFLYFQFDMKMKRNRGLIFILFPAILLFCVVSIRSGCDYIGLYTIFGNLITALNGPGDTAIISLIK
jgi:hypothetical protein